MTRVGLIGGKDIGPLTGRIVGTSPRLLMVFILALTEAAQSILLRCFLDWYWLSTGPPQYEVDGRPRFWSKFNFGNSPAGCGSDRGPAGWLPQIYIYIVNEGTLRAF